MARFSERVRDLPRLGIGVSTEYGASLQPGSLDVWALRRERAHFARFLELGVEIAKGLDDDAERWVTQGLPSTYHFLDINREPLEEYAACANSADVIRAQALFYEAENEETEEETGRRNRKTRIRG